MTGSMDSTNLKSRRDDLLLVSILALVMAVRLFGINHGLPYGYQIDEKYVVNHAMAFGTGDFNPHAFQWPGTSLMFFVFLEYAITFVVGWLLQVFHSAKDFAGLFMSDPSIFYLEGRISIALLGTATVFLTYRLGRQIYGPAVGLIGASFFGFSYIAVGIDHSIFPDTPLTFLAVAEMLLFQRILRQGSGAAYWQAGAVLGLAVATKYSGAAFILPFGIVHLLRVYEEGKGLGIGCLFDRRVLFFSGSAVVAFVLFCPFSILDFSTFSRDLLWQFQRVHSGSFGTDVKNAWFYYIVHGLPNCVGVGLAAVSILGFFYAVGRRKKEDLPLIAFVAFYFLYIGNWKVGVDKYLLPILPFLGLFAALLVERGLRLKALSLHPLHRYAEVLCVLLLILEPLAYAIHSDYLLCQKDTRTLAKEWIEENLPQGTKIALDSGNFDVAKFSPPLNDSKQSLQEEYSKLQEKFPKTWASSKEQIERYLDIKMKYLKGKTYELVHIVYATDGSVDREVSLDAYAKDDVAYIVVSSYAYGVYDDPVYRERNPEAARYYGGFYHSLDSHCELTKVFYPLSKRGPGPVIKIYRVLHNGA
jgi:hypothetical protein